MAHMDTVPICLGSKPSLEDGLCPLGRSEDRPGGRRSCRRGRGPLRRRWPFSATSCRIRRSRSSGRCKKRSACTAPDSPILACSAIRSWPSIGTAAARTLTRRRDRRLSHADRNRRPGEPRRRLPRAGRQRDRDRRAGDRRAASRAAGTATSAKGKRRGTSNIGVIAAARRRTSSPITCGSRPKPAATIRVPRADRQGDRDGVSAGGARGEKLARPARQGRHSTGGSTTRRFDLADDEPCVLAAEAACAPIGVEPFRAISNGGLDANWMTAHGIPTVTLGLRADERAYNDRSGSTCRRFKRACRVAIRLTGDVADRSNAF